MIPSLDIVYGVRSPGDVQELRISGRSIHKPGYHPPPFRTKCSQSVRLLVGLNTASASIGTGNVVSSKAAALGETSALLAIGDGRLLRLSAGVPIVLRYVQPVMLVKTSDFFSKSPSVTVTVQLRSAFGQVINKSYGVPEGRLELSVDPPCKTHDLAEQVQVQTIPGGRSVTLYDTPLGKMTYRVWKHTTTSSGRSGSSVLWYPKPKKPRSSDSGKKIHILARMVYQGSTRKVRFFIVKPRKPKQC